MDSALKIIICFWIAAFGICLFSFLNAVAYRLPRKISFVKGFSFCPSCNHQLAAKDLVPIFSWLWLKGHCRYCQAQVSIRYLLVEVWGGALALLCYFNFANYVQAVWMFAFFALLTLVALIDLDIMEIPDKLVLAILGLAILAFFIDFSPLWWERIIGFFAVSLFLYLIALIIPSGFGGGDIKLMAVCGLALGYKLILAAFFLAILTGGLYGIFLLISGKKGRKEHFAFGPFLCFGILIAALWGEHLIAWYWKFLT